MALYKFLYCIVLYKFFSFAPVSNTRGHRYKLFVEQSTRNVRHYVFVDELSIYGIICRPLLTFPPWLNSSVVCYKLICQSTYCILLISKVVFQDGCKCSIEPFYLCLSCFYCYVPDVKLSCMSVLNFYLKITTKVSEFCKLSALKNTPVFWSTVYLVFKAYYKCLN